MSGSLDITPHTRIGEMLETYPQLEALLIERSPVFAKLRNPVLRRTVARVATVEKVAGVAGIEVRELVALLRRAVGQAVQEGPESASTGPTAQPSWVDEGTVVETIDADALLAAGEVPLARVVGRGRSLGPGERLRVVSSFRPVPLIEALERANLRAYCAADDGGRFHTTVAPGSDRQS